MCDNCKYNIANINANNIKLCKKCINDNTVSVTQIHAVTWYPVSVKDLKNIRCTDRNVPGTTHKYLVKDIEYIGTIKYGGKDGYDSALAKKIKFQNDKQQNKIADQTHRKNEINDYLKSMNLDGDRDDCLEYHRYINQEEGSQYTKEDVCKAVRILQFYDTKTEYLSILPKLKDIEKLMKETELGLSDQLSDELWKPWNDLEVIYRSQKIAMYMYIIRNYANLHKSIAEMPLELLSDYNECYDNIKSRIKVGFAPRGFLKPNINRVIDYGHYHSFYKSGHKPKFTSGNSDLIDI